MKAGPKTAVCSVCDDTGWKPLGGGVDRRVTRCDCRLQARTGTLLEAARIPKRFERSELSNFLIEFGGRHDSSLAAARWLCETFAEKFIPGQTTQGLLIMGPVGSGKTHLAVGVIKELVRHKGVACLFYDFRELLREIRRSYDPATETTELGVLSPIFDVDVLLLDDLGAFATTVWERDTIAYILNKRYSDEKPTIVTTYLADKPAPRVEAEPATALRSRNEQEARAATRERTLGERIGDQMRARLHEMCKKVEISAPDYRDRAKTGPRF